MKTYRYILLDWDGNLAKTLEVWLGAIEIVLRKRKVILPRNILARAAGGGILGFLTEHTSLSDAQAAVALEEIVDVVTERLPLVELYPDAIDVLRELKAANKQLAVITSSTRPHVEILLKKFSMEDLFDAVVCAGDTEHRKPHAQPLQKALNAIGGVEAEAIMIGDTEKDIMAAHNAGVDSILFYPTEHRDFYDLDALKSHNPTYIVEDFRSIPDIIHNE